MQRVSMLALASLTVVGLALVLPACGGGDSTVRVELETDDNLTLIADHWEGKGTWVLLGHQYPDDRGPWGSIAELLHEEGNSVLAWDFRCHGESECDAESKRDAVQNIWRDWNTALDYAVGEGATSIYAVGASMGGNSALQVAADRPEITALATLSAPRKFAGLDAVTPYERVTVPRLLIVGEDDKSAPEFSQWFHDNSVGPSRLVIFDTELHGNPLAVSDTFRPAIEALLLAFVTDTLATITSTDPLPGDPPVAVDDAKNGTTEPE